MVQRVCRSERVWPETSSLWAPLHEQLWKLQVLLSERLHGDPWWLLHQWVMSSSWRVKSDQSCAFIWSFSRLQTPEPALSLTVSMVVRRSRGRSAASARLQGCSLDRMNGLVLVRNMIWGLLIYLVSSLRPAVSSRSTSFFMLMLFCLVCMQIRDFYEFYSSVIIKTMWLFLLGFQLSWL